MDRRQKHRSSSMNMGSARSPRLRIIEPELPSLPCLPKATNKDDFNDSDSSCISSYYIPGITGKARCLDYSPSYSSPPREALRKSKKLSARELYAPSSSDGARESFSNSLSSLPLMDVYTKEEEDDEEEEYSMLARSLPTDMSLDHLDAEPVRTSFATRKEQLESQLGSIRGLLEEHDSRKGVKQFKALREQKRNRKPGDQNQR